MQWLSLNDAAHYAQVSYRTMLRWSQDGRLRTTQLGRRRMTCTDWVDELLLSGESSHGRRARVTYCRCLVVLGVAALLAASAGAVLLPAGDAVTLIVVAVVYCALCLYGARAVARAGRRHGTVGADPRLRETWTKE